MKCNYGNSIAFLFLCISIFQIGRKNKEEQTYNWRLLKTQECIPERTHGNLWTFCSGTARRWCKSSALWAKNVLQQKLENSLVTIIAIGVLLSKYNIALLMIAGYCFWASVTSSPADECRLLHHCWYCSRVCSPLLVQAKTIFKVFYKIPAQQFRVFFPTVGTYGYSILKKGWPNSFLIDVEFKRMVR